MKEASTNVNGVPILHLFKKSEAEVTDHEAPSDLDGEIFSVDDAVNKVGYGKFQIRLTCIAGLAYLVDSSQIIVLSVIGDFLSCDWFLARWQIAMLTSVVFIGMMIGSPILGCFADKYGRKKCLSVAVTLLFIFGEISAASPSYEWLLVFRTLMGVALGGISQGITLSSEYYPAKMRGRAGFYLCYFWALGIVGATLLAWVVMKYLNSWRILLAVSAVPALLVIASLKWCPESARYYLVSNKYIKATHILQKMAKDNGTNLPPGRLVEVKDSYGRGRVNDLLGKEYRLTTLLFWYIWFATAFAYYGIALISPAIIREGNIINATENDTESYFDNMNTVAPCAKFSQRFYIDLLWTSASEFPGIVIFTILVDHLSRKALLVSTCFISSVFIILLLLNTNKVILLLFLFGARGIIGSIFQLIYIMTTEAFPTTFRALAMGTGTAFSRLGGTIVPHVAQVLVIGNPIAAMCLLSGVIFLSGIAAAFLPFETRGAKMKDVLTTYE